VALFSPDRVILATDADREGEAIAFHLATAFGLSLEKTPRIAFGEITRAAILRAVAAPGRIDMDLVRAQHVRQVLDIVIGFKVSPVLWKYVFHTSGVTPSAGRCQTPALRLIYDNYVRSTTHAPDMRIVTTGTFFATSSKFRLDKVWKDRDETRAFLEASRAHQHTTTMSPGRLETAAAPLPLNTAALLQLAAQRLRLSPKQTMQLAQELYQAGHITYMRTSARTYCAEFAAEAARHVAARFGAEYCGAPPVTGQYKAAGGGAAGPAEPPREAHEAVRVSHIEVEATETGDPRAGALYKLIWRATMQSCMADATYITHDIKVAAPMEATYTRKAHIPQFAGWRAAARKGDDEGGEDGADDTALVSLIMYSPEPKVAPVQQIECVEELHGVHTYLTDAAIVRELEDRGIGRPSTFASFTDALVLKRYVTRTDVPGETRECVSLRLCFDTHNNTIIETKTNKTFGAAKQRLVITKEGIQCIEFLVRWFGAIFEYGYTREMEEALDAVAHGAPAPRDIVGETYGLIDARAAAIRAGAAVRTTFALEEGATLEYHKLGAMVHVAATPDRAAFTLPLKEGITIDFERLGAGEYTSADIAAFKDGLLGQWKGADVMLRVGRFGPYIESGDKRVTLKPPPPDLAAFTLAEAVAMLDPAAPGNIKTGGEGAAGQTGVLRALDARSSVRAGKYGHYVYYLPEGAAKPALLSLKTFPGKFLDCETTEVLEWAKTEAAKPKRKAAPAKYKNTKSKK
jgi:DNA topoisomerase-1